MLNVLDPNASHTTVAVNHTASKKMEANLTTDNIESYVVFLASGSGNVLFPTFFFTVFGPKTLPMWKKIYRAHWVYIKTAHFSISLLHLIVHQGFPSGSDYKYGPSGDSDMNWI